MKHITELSPVFAANFYEAQNNVFRTNSRVDFFDEHRIVQFAPPCSTPIGGSCDFDGIDDTSAQETPYGITSVNRGGATYT